MGYSISDIQEIYKDFVKGKDKILKLSYQSGDYILIQDGDDMSIYGNHLKVVTTESLLIDRKNIQFIDCKQVRNVTVMDNIKSDLKDFLNEKGDIIKRL